MPDAIMTLNAGSSSIKAALFEITPGATPDRLQPLARAAIEGIGDTPTLRTDGQDRHRWSEPHPADDALLGQLLAWADDRLGQDRLVGVGHRVVHGGDTLNRPHRVTPALLDTLDALVPLAPLHQPHNLSPIRAIATRRPGLAQTACFDTAFHRTIPAIAARYALPPDLEHPPGGHPVRRYGFHGLSYEYIAHRLRQTDPALAEGRVVVAHLGNGASLCALEAGRSVDTTMGATALDGLVMGTRCGSLDPGAVLYLVRTGRDPADLERALYQRAGLLGLSGTANDMRTLLASPDPRAAQALDVFVYRLARETAAMAAALGGLDALVFTAGIGEHSAPIRARLADRLAWLGLRLDPQANDAHAPTISHPDSKVALRIITTDEEAMIAHHTLATLT